MRTRLRLLAAACLAVGSVVAVPVGPAWGGASAATGPSTPPQTPTTRAAIQPRPTQPPVLAYYYIWFDRSSWDRAKTDLPRLGPYSSDDEGVMRQHIRWAKAAGIQGFVVSWKHSATLDRRLELLTQVAQSERFGLAIMYEGLDVKRQPLPADRVARDLDFLVATFAGREPFHLLWDKPLVIWSGTWKFSRADVASVTGGRRGPLRILSSERNVDGYGRLADLVDGDAYYWSSVDPDGFHGYLEKLVAMGRAVHARNGLWIAPAAPGFDARLVGGTSVVARRDGETLGREIAAAAASSPDALGLISWNEFSENTDVEPSVRYGFGALNVLAERLGTGVLRPGDEGAGTPVAQRHAGARAAARAPSGDGLDSSAPGAKGPRTGLAALIGLVVMFGAFVVVTARRARASSGSARGAVAPAADEEATPDDGLPVREGRPRKRGGLLGGVTLLLVSLVAIVLRRQAGSR